MTEQQPSEDLTRLPDSLFDYLLARWDAPQEQKKLFRLFLELHNRRVAAWCDTLAAAESLDHITNMLIQAVLLAAGFHKDQIGEWRR